jgi:hypothetical protein
LEKLETSKGALNLLMKLCPNAALSSFVIQAKYKTLPEPNEKQNQAYKRSVEA